MRVGAAALIGMPALRAWGWTGQRPAGIGAVVDEGWILRVPPGWGPRIRGWIEEDGRAGTGAGAPSIVVEESPWVFLPVDVSGVSWPRAESWIHAQRLLGVAVAPKACLAPRDAGELVAGLRAGDEESGRRPIAPERAALLAWDLLCAATAWERRRAACWMARHAMGHATEASAREWRRRAAEWSLRLQEPSVERSVACARDEAGVVRLGLDELGSRVAEVAEAIVLERELRGPFLSGVDFALRARRVGVAVRTVLAFVATGALETLPRMTVLPAMTALLKVPALPKMPALLRVPEPSVARARQVGSVPAPAREFVFPGTERGAVCGLSCLSP